MSVIRQIMLSLLAVIFAIGFVIVFRALSLRPPPAELEPCHMNESDYIDLGPVSIERFQQALQFQTVTRGKHLYDREQLNGLVEHMITSFPTVHQSSLVTWQRVANYSLLYTVQGSNPQLKPYLLMGHLDVVPADNAEAWEIPPFSGSIHNGYIYGRGTVDDKHTVFGVLEALEFKLTKAWKPQRTLYIAFGHDEEAVGIDGAHNIASLLKQRRVEFEFILDEGTMILSGSTFGTQKPVALCDYLIPRTRTKLGERSLSVAGPTTWNSLSESVLAITDETAFKVSTSEKGYLSIKMSVSTAGGHSSMPQKESSIGILSNAVLRLESNPHDSMFGRGPEVGICEHIAPYIDFPKRIFMANLWLFAPLVSRFFSAAPFTNAVVRTTTAVTVFNAGIKENILPPYAEAIVNHRIHPAQTIDEILQRDREIIADDRIKLEIIDSIEPHPMSDYGPTSFGFQTIARSVRQVWGGSDNVIVTPALMVANTDTKYYLELSRNVYRFSPGYMTVADLPRFHGVNERIAVENYQQTINFYCHVMINADRDSLFTAQHRGHSVDL